MKCNQLIDYIEQRREKLKNSYQDQLRVEMMETSEEQKIVDQRIPDNTVQLIYCPQGIVSREL